MPEEQPTTPLMTKRVNLFLDEDLYSRLNDAAWTTRVSMSEFIRQAIREKIGQSEG
tara:strand:- start:5750 stop:5917 length:168 start_codon:yes stop_codon:yes gene_type:complete